MPAGAGVVVAVEERALFGDHQLGAAGFAFELHGACMHTSNTPPARISALASGTLQVAGLNQFLMCSAVLKQ